MTQPLTTAENMALAVLRGDMIAARQLADYLLESYSGGAVEVPAVKKVTCERDRLRVVVYLKEGNSPESDEEYHAAQQFVNHWLANENNPLILNGVDRIELFELPKEVSK